MDKLELKHLAPYLPYGLKMIFEGKGGRTITLTGITNQGKYGVTITDGNFPMWLNGSGFKPILRPLSDLTKDIEHNGVSFVPSNVLYDQYSLKFNNDGSFFLDYYEIGETDSPFTGYAIIDQLMEWHFDIYSLIPAGLAIDINTLEGGSDAKA